MRPDIEHVSRAQDVHDWYWTKNELVRIARRVGARRSGTKQQVTDSIVAALNGEVNDASSTTARTRGRIAERTVLSPPYSRSMQVPEGQPLSRSLREWLEVEMAGDFTANAAVRALLKEPNGATLADLITVSGSRADPGAPIGAQFERNRFLRFLATSEPGLSRSEREQRWRDFRQLPTSERLRVLKEVP